MVSNYEGPCTKIFYNKILQFDTWKGENPFGIDPQIATQFCDSKHDLVDQETCNKII